jgi:hypothetical protein
MSSNPFRGDSERGGYDITAAGVERAPDAYGVALDESKEEETRLRKKFRGLLPAEVLAPIKADTHWGSEQRLRKRVYGLLKTNLTTVRRDPAAFFKDEATDVASLLRENESNRTVFLDSLLWDLYVIHLCWLVGIGCHCLRAVQCHRVLRAHTPPGVHRCHCVWRG